MKKIIFIFIILIAAVVIACIITASRGLFGIFVPLTIIFPAVILAFIFSLLGRSRKNKEKLLKTGEPAKAKVLSVSDTGVTINGSPRIAIQLEVTPQNGTPFNAITHALISRIQPQFYKVGMILQVRYDPKDPKTVAIESVSENEAHDNVDGDKRIDMKSLLCPSCGGQIKMDDSLYQEKVITCKYCGTVINLHE